MNGKSKRLVALLRDVKEFVDESAEVFLDCNAPLDPKTREPSICGMRPVDRRHYRGLCGLSRRIDRELGKIAGEAKE